jgi:DNA-binding beta-propeller fold protein YncE
VLPQLRDIERRFRREVVVVGVHSGKYIAERDTARIREAALRLGVDHPIVNDRQFRVWREYTVRAWPTLVVVDPLGAILGTHAGEFSAEQLSMFIGRVIDAYDQTGDMDYEPRELRLDVGAIAPGTLRYPGKVAVDGERIAVADTGHHRVLVGRLESNGRTMRVEHVYGGTAGLRDGADPELDSPQGLVFDGDVLWVSDPGNHTVRRVALDTREVTTIAGTGQQLRTRADLEAGALSSPYDVTVADGTLFVAMAGTHQLYAIDPATRAVRAHSGTGREEIVDGAHDSAALAQPMGIAAAGDRLYFVDSESSAVRWANASPRGEVRTIVGTGLFDFGDKDGVGDDVRMQHQQGLAVHPSGRLLVCDTYNDALKWVDPATREATTWLRGFHEPTGVALANGLAYVADQNAHRIAVADEATGSVEDLEIVM